MKRCLHIDRIYSQAVVRPLFYMFIALLISSCADRGFLRQKYTQLSLSRQPSKDHAAKPQKHKQSETPSLIAKTKAKEQQRGESIAMGMSVLLGIIVAALLALLVVGIIMLFKGMFTGAIICLGIFVLFIGLFFLSNLL